MLEKKRVTLHKLISFILSFSKENHKDANLDIVFENIKSNDEFKFENLKYGEQKNINDFPKQIKNIFDPFIRDFKRIGSRSILPNINSNVSLFFSILNQLNQDFYKMSIEEQASAIVKLRDKLIIHLSTDKIMEFYGYDVLGWSKKDLTNSLVQYKSNKMVLKLLADYFNINIFVLNISEDKLYLLSGNNYYNMFRQNTFLIFFNDNFEPLMYNNKFLLKYNSEPLKKLIHVDKGFIKLLSVNFSQNRQEAAELNFKIVLEDLTNKITNNNDNTSPQSKSSPDAVDDVNKYGEVYLDESDAPIEDIESNRDKTHKPSVEKVESTSKNIFIEKEQPSVVKFNISSKMKLEEIQNIAKKYNIGTEKTLDTGKKKLKTKTELIDDLQKIL